MIYRKGKDPVAALFRQSVDRFIQSANEPTLKDRYDRVLSLAGKYESDVTDLGANHDKYLAETYGVVGE